MKANLPSLDLLPESLAVCRFASNAAIPEWVHSRFLMAIVRTPDELSVVCAQALVPSAVQAERGWRAWKVQGPLDFTLIGVLAGLTGALAAAGVSLFAISTYDTDYLLVKEHHLAKARLALAQAGYRLNESE